MAEVKFSDGRGIMSGMFCNQNRDITKDDWLREVFPEWGTFLNREMENTVVEKGQVALWWFGGPSFGMKTSSGEIFLIDNYAGPSIYTEYDYCGVCRTSGAKSLNWFRLGPMVVDPWEFKKLDAVFCSHHHQDHTDFYTVKATLKTTNCQYVGSKSAAAKLRGFDVPEDRITEVVPGDTVKIGNTEVQALLNYDTMAAMTGAESPDKLQDIRNVAVSFLFKTDGGNILLLADTLYNNGYAAFKKYDIDVVLTNMGYAPPGATDKMNPFDAFRVAQAVGAKYLIPYHYDNWANSQEDPATLEYIVEKKRNEHRTDLKTIILQPGAMLMYPQQKDIGRYTYPDYVERYDSEYSWEYGKPRE
jgi:L-ascorbate 6-phosphate lactonase